MTARIVSVSELTEHIRRLIESDEVLQDVWVEGEVSSFTVAKSGHAYFTLASDGVVLDGIMWRSYVGRQRTLPQVGDQIIAHGRVTIYDQRSRYQLQTDVLHPAGAGLLQAQLEQLRQRLEADGLFDQTRKRALPAFPKRIGVATSPTGSVWHDIQQVIARRYPLVELVLAPTIVQGDQAPESIIAALDQLQRVEGIDVIIVARGGGSIEDLWCFNDERVVRAVFASPIPVVSAIGHETDTTLIDDVADLRAATPSVAAELVVPDASEIHAAITEAQRSATRYTRYRLTEVENKLLSLGYRLQRLSPTHQVAAMRTSTDELQRRLSAATWAALRNHRHRVEATTDILAVLDPKEVMQRGYSMITNEATGQIITSATDLSPGTEVRLAFADGAATSQVHNVEVDGLGGLSSHDE